MILEIEFIRDYTSFWRTISPLSEDLVRHINCQVLSNKINTELLSSTLNSRRGLINEIGFELFNRSFLKKIIPEEIETEELMSIANSVGAYIAQLRSNSPLFNTILETQEIIEVKKIAHRLFSFFEKFNNVVIRPEFAGCGRLNSCNGDVIADGILYEIKSGGRKFRSVDLRQLVLYLTLNRYSKQYLIHTLGLYNPRQGLHFVLPCQEFSLQFCGLSTEELCHRIAYELNLSDLGRFEDGI
ncbi:hypothetical protein OQJ26_13585 [Legionella sp. PATHC038]|uniref:hypothetical protein n=1 Tax=Legionella sheltonii TaxID=2992041 RepID=UPI002243AB11|nr:hypothetical protein [Legionella sp. PATHC038]MCW8399820.1 hypothetical protein [Legionella sp. PATHC038]